MIIVTATLTEAKALIEPLGLIQHTTKPFLTFENPDHRLIVSGIGKVKAAAALSHILTKTPQPVLNIGYAAGKKVGELYNIHKVIDASSNKVFHLQRHPAFFNAACTTFERPLAQPIETIADMEASALVECANIYKTPITILKIVSDPFSPEKMAKNSILIERNVEKILSLLWVKSRKNEEQE